MNLQLKNSKLYLVTGVFYFIFEVFADYVSTPDSLGLRVVNNIWRTVYLTAVNYLFFEYFMPKMGLKQWLRTLLFLFAQFILFTFGAYLWRMIGVCLHIYTSFKDFKTIQDGACEQLPFSLLSLVIFGAVSYAYKYVQLKQMAQQLRIEKQEAELNFLKSQTNPHFLFNTLNNIYALARDKSDLAPESILRLSDILRFMLYKNSNPFIEIGQEVEIISDYIALEKLRYDETLRVDFKYEIRDMKQLIPPMLLIPLVENAFKHGVAETRKHPLVQIYLSVTNNKLYFLVKNSAEPTDQTGAIRENIGLSNLRRQLELLYTAHDLSVAQKDDLFTVTLTIDLRSHV